MSLVFTARENFLDLLPNIVISVYESSYEKGKVIAFGIYLDDIIQNENFNTIFTQLLESLFKRR